MRIMGKHGGSKAAATAIVNMIVKDKFFRIRERDDANRALKKMGTYAEDAVLPMLSLPNDIFRQFAYDVLGDAGTEKSIPLLRAAAGKEKQNTMSREATSAVRKIVERTKKPASE